MRLEELAANITKIVHKHMGESIKLSPTGSLPESTWQLWASRLTNALGRGHLVRVVRVTTERQPPHHMILITWPAGGAGAVVQLGDGRVEASFECAGFPLHLPPIYGLE